MPVRVSQTQAPAKPKGRRVEQVEAPKVPKALKATWNWARGIVQAKSPEEALVRLNAVMQAMAKGRVKLAPLTTYLAVQIRLLHRGRTELPSIPAPLNAALAQLVVAEPGTRLVNNIVSKLRSTSPSKPAWLADRPTAMFYGFPSKDRKIDLEAMGVIAQRARGTEIIFGSNSGLPTKQNVAIARSKGNPPPFEPLKHPGLVKQGIKFAFKMPIDELENRLARLGPEGTANYIATVLKNRKWDYVQIDELRAKTPQRVIDQLPALMQAMAKKPGMDQRLIFWLRMGAPLAELSLPKYKAFLDAARIHARAVNFETYPDGRGLGQKNAIYADATFPDLPGALEEPGPKPADDVVNGTAEGRIEQVAARVSAFSPGMNVAALTGIGVWLAGRGLRYGAVTLDNYKDVFKQQLSVLRGGAHARYQRGWAAYSIARMQVDPAQAGAMSEQELKRFEARRKVVWAFFGDRARRR